MLTDYQVFQKKNAGKGWNARKMGEEWRKKKKSASKTSTSSPPASTKKKAKGNNTCNAPAKALDKDLYCKAKAHVKRTIKVWPSAYGSMLLVKDYKKRGGRYVGPKEGWGEDRSSSSPSKSKYKNKKGGVTRWLKEEWVNVCKEKRDGTYAKCGRSKSRDKDYPYCRPLHRITEDTPMTVAELKKEYGKSKIKKMCEKKQSVGKPSRIRYDD